ncbi:hypothetical protein [Legionella shakespearei]|uniref:Uncharacterized protein n=1 Tax=Legionella shakespearei DSM 23087 TaxID=1122169 RepID=A0A0W0YV76_9GAMM|nr:hypothetical protein [Legionella shakespearei]KTD60760.1 hypothetical protein Lsha_1477 [Legionella shakespearei DSM 23087]
MEDKAPEQNVAGNQVNTRILPQDKIVQEEVLNQLKLIRDDIQKQLYDTASPAREAYVQKANFTYALIYKVKDEFQSPKDIMKFIHELEKKYPLAIDTIDQVKHLPGMQAFL